ncbi:MAG: VOC family protein [Proteobacteria bacterium]|nr:VOC family protein [Pseudomonadota bacterium]
MAITGVDAITYGVSNMKLCRQFLADWGLKRVRSSATSAIYETLDGSQVRIRPRGDKSLPKAFAAGSTVREVVWGVTSKTELSRIRKALERQGVPVTESHGMLRCIDPAGLGIAFRVSKCQKVKIEGTKFNVVGARDRIDQPATFYDRARPVSLGHVVLNVPDLKKAEHFYRGVLGFHLSDRYPGDAVFLRCQPTGEHHNLFLLETPDGMAGLNHVAFEVHDIHEIVGGGMHIARQGWKTAIGPGRHPISSAYFWYVENPCGGLIEYYSDVDYVTAKWKPRDCARTAENFAEWAVNGGIDGNSRRQKV